MGDSPKEFCESTYTGYYDNECTSVQNYCNINGQSALDNLTENFINNKFSSINQGSKIIPQNLEDIYQIIIRISTFGQWEDSNGEAHLTGTQNPTPFSFDDIITGNKALLNSYNKILNGMGFNVLSENTLLSKNTIDILKTNIKNYQLNADRCHTCNVSKNCSQGGGGCGDCSDCTHGGSGEGCDCYGEWGVG